MYNLPWVGLCTEMSRIDGMKANECVVVDTSEAWYLPSGLDTINGTLPPDVSKLPARPIYATDFAKIGWMMAG